VTARGCTPISPSMSSRIQQRQGSILLVFGVSLTLLLGVSALVMDMGRVYWTKLKLQSAADAAALAATQELALTSPTYTPDVVPIVQEFATLNAADSVEIPYLDLEARGIVVGVSREIPSIFAKLIGVESFVVEATSAAGAFGVGKTGGLIPIAVQDSHGLENGWVESETVVTIFDDAPEGSGTFGWVDYNGGSSSAVDLAYSIRNPDSSGVWEIGDLVLGATGISVANDVRAAVDEWENLHFTVPLYQQTTLQGSGMYYVISGFGEFQLLDAQLTGNPKQLTGLFIRFVKPGAMPGGRAASKLSALALTQ
jgi:hypothetical protein